MSKKLFLSPHNDDETLFGAYTIMREKPLVVICTDSYIEQERGDDATTQQRIDETKKAMKLAGVEVEFLHIPDKSILDISLVMKLREYKADIVYAPAIELGGNGTHNLVGEVADRMFKNVKHYMTYGYTNYTKTKGSELIIPTEKEKALKEKMLRCYPSQLKIKTTAPFFTNKDVLEYESFE